MDCHLVSTKPLSDQCWNIVKWIVRNKFRWNLNRNSYIFVQGNAFENVVCNMAATFSQPQCVNITYIWQSGDILISGYIFQYYCMSISLMHFKWYRDLNTCSVKYNVCSLSGIFTDLFDGLVQDCSNSNVLAIELLQPCTEPSIWLDALPFLSINPYQGN